MLEVRIGRVLALIGAIFWGFFFFGVIDLIVPVLQTEGFYESYLLETGWGILYVGLVAAPLLATAFRPHLVVPLLQVAVAGLAVTVTGLLTPVPIQPIAGVGLLATVVTISYLTSSARDRRLTSQLRLTLTERRVDWRTLALTAAAAIPLLVFAADMIAGARQGRPPTDDFTMGIDHWPMQAALAVTLAGAAGLASLWLPGWGVSATTVCLATTWMGGRSVAYPNRAGSFGTIGGALALLWSLLLAIVSIIRARRPPKRSMLSPRRSGET